MSYPIDSFSSKEITLIRRFFLVHDRALESLREMAKDCSFTPEEIKTLLRFIRNGNSEVSA